MTAIDDSHHRVGTRPGLRAEREDALLRFVLADVFEFGQMAGQFDLVYDIGLYHFVRHTDLEQYLNLLWRVTQPGSYYFTIAARKADPAPGSASPLAKRQLHSSWAGCSEWSNCGSAGWRALCAGRLSGLVVLDASAASWRDEDRLASAQFRRDKPGGSLEGGSLSVIAASALGSSRHLCADFAKSRQGEGDAHCGRSHAAR